MKTTLVIILLIALSRPIVAQETRDTSSAQIVLFPDLDAEFPGGTAALLKYITENIVYPDGYGQIDVVGKIFIAFVVNTDGSVSDVKVERGIEAKLDEMGKNLILGMPRWKPAETDGKPVRSYVRLPINIHSY